MAPNPFSKKKNPLATQSYGSQIDALVQQKKAAAEINMGQPGAMQVASPGAMQGSGGGQTVDLYPQPIPGNPGGLVHSPSYMPVPSAHQQPPSPAVYIPTQSVVSQSQPLQPTEVYVPMSNMQHQGQGGQPPIMYNNQPSGPPQAQRQDVWIPYIGWFNAWHYNPKNPNRFGHALLACLTSWAYDPKGAAKVTGKIIVTGVGIFFVGVGLVASCTRQTKTITVGPATGNPTEIVDSVRRSLPEVEIR